MKRLSLPPRFVFWTVKTNGKTWQDKSISKVKGVNFWGIAIDPDLVRVCGSGGSLYQGSSTLIKHTTWSQINLGIEKVDYKNIVFTAYKKSLVAGDHSSLFSIIRTLYGWRVNSFSFPYEYDFNDIFFLYNLYGWIIGKYGIVLKSTDTGNSWDVIAQLDNNELYSVQFLSTKVGYTVGTNGSLFKSVDGGYNWQQINTGVTNLFKKVQFINYDTGWIVGTNGVILKTTNANNLVISNVEKTESLPSEYSLSQNYPNPFNPSTTISFKIPKTDFVSLKIYDALGNEIKTIVNEIKTAGKFSVNFDGSNLPSGVYFYRLTSGNFSKTKKLLLLK